MLHIRRFDHVGITVADLDTVTAFFLALGLEVESRAAAVEMLAADGYGLVGGNGEYEQTWRMAHVRGPEGLIVFLAAQVS